MDKFDLFLVLSLFLLYNLVNSWNFSLHVFLFWSTMSTLFVKIAWSNNANANIDKKQIPRSFSNITSPGFVFVLDSFQWIFRFLAKYQQFVLLPNNLIFMVLEGCPGSNAKCLNPIVISVSVFSNFTQCLQE